MKAAVLVASGAPLEIWSDLEIPRTKLGQVLVKIAYSAVCHSQLMEQRGRRGPDLYLPHLLGHEATGIVQAIGSGVSKIRVGDAVVLGWIKGQGLEAGGSIYRSPRGSVNSGAVATFNEYAVVSENRCVKLPPSIPLDLGALLGCAIPTGAGIVIHTLNPKPGSTLAVFGLGGIGLSALAATQLFQCSQIIAVDISPQKLDLATNLGATHTILSGKLDPVAEIRNLTEGRGCDFAVDATGQVRGIEQAFECVRRQGGMAVFASHPGHGEKISLDPFDLINGKRIVGSWGGESQPDADIPLFGDLYAQGKLPLDRLIGHRYALDEINLALEDLEAHRTARPLIEIDPSLRAS